MPLGDKYAKLKQYLENSGKPMIVLTYDQIEQILGFRLPESAIKFPEEWWNNTNSSQGVSWLNAGYSTDCVTDTYDKKTMIFRKD